tara:strand:- start:471 stop:611 length:141 start_codon:yes stop_codon:yes gene_type:complete
MASLRQFFLWKDDNLVALENVKKGRFFSIPLNISKLGVKNEHKTNF